MSVSKRILSITLSLLCMISFAKAQILDDEDISSAQKPELADETAKDEALFDELFSDYTPEERDITKIKTFGEAIDRISENIDKKPTEKETKTPEEELPPIEGMLRIGITKNSFHIYQNAFNEPACDFTVTVKSSVNRYIKVMALNLIYSKSAFAFIFRDIKEGTSVTEPIRTMGDICYNLTGVPDIDINKCKILGAASKECAERIEWSNELTYER